jgi:hypothetical protein
MSSTYTGNASNITPSATVDGTIAADGDAITAAARNVALQELLDYIAFLKRAGYDGTHTIKKLNIDAAGNNSNGNANGTLAVSGASGNEQAITATGAGTGAGVVGYGGASSGTGVVGQGGASNGNGGTFEGDGTGWGVKGTGGDSNGTGVVGVGGTTNGVGVEGTGTGTGAGLKASGATISSATVGSGQAVPLGAIYKDTTILAWGYVQYTGATTVALTRGANVASVTRTGVGLIGVVYQTVAPNTSAPVVTVQDGTANVAYFTAGNVGGSGFQIQICDMAGTPTDCAVNGGFTFMVVGG